MEAAGLSIAVFNEVFLIGKFIRQVMIDAKNRDGSLERLALEFEHQQVMLSTFDKLFLKSGFIYEIGGDLNDQIRRILEQLKRIVGEYSRLAARYDKDYTKTLKVIDKWWESGIRSSGKRNEAGEPKTIRLESVKTTEPTNPAVHGGKRSWGRWHFSRAQFSQMLTSLEWALFNKEKLESLVRDHGDWVSRLIEAIKLPLYAQGAFWRDSEKLGDFLQTDAKTLGVSKIATVRKFVLDLSQVRAVELDAKLIATVGVPHGLNGSPTGTASPVGEGDLRNGKYDNQDVLIEYKHGPRPQHATNSEIAKGRIQDLSKLLGVECSSDEPTESNNFTLHCLGFFHEPGESRYGLAFALPRDREPEPMSLYKAIGSLTGRSRPTLGQRFTIAHNIGHTLIEWFLVGWVHKSINSKNILFFRQEHQGLDFGSPYLCGFEYARRGGEVSNEVIERRGIHWDLYRHPARQGLPTEAFGKIHDIYAFGVFLLELGLWQPASKLLDPAVKTIPSIIQQVLVKNARDRLGHFMGQKYRDAVLLCLESALVVDTDDSMGSRLIAAFKERVVSIFEEGRKL
ncbi:hypothetical protein C7212DRAFT_365307 [Tuber magnatum]|uniref:Uncharacterized protein n=1 Tax=Tuber magnatum TaxID=42249 RepID=A0A317SIL7_9PEZI|nr:hypothetical protein C7212DRAFT_365307 [Tuber magnatum]